MNDKGNAIDGKEALHHAYKMQEMWQAQLSKGQEVLRCLRLWQDSEDSYLCMADS